MALMQVFRLVDLGDAILLRKQFFVKLDDDPLCNIIQNWPLLHAFCQAFIIF